MSESQPNWDAYLKVASLSDIGMRRANNQDNLIVSLASTMDAWQRKGHLFVVADGMGAHAAGELASKLAVDHIPHLYAKFNDVSAPEALKKAMVGANTEINRRGQANEDFHQMGTTCCALALLPQGAVVAHIGDSRVYRLRNNRIEQLTFDHSLVWEMKASGQLSPEQEALGKIPKNVITRSLGPYPDCNVDLEGPFAIEVGDIFLLCTDGLTGLVEDHELGPILSNLEPTEAARVLVDLANLRGGPDNTTVIIAKVTHPQLATSPNSAPFSVNGSKQKSKTNLVPITIFGLGLLVAALVFVFTKSWVATLFPGIIGIAGLIWTIVELASASSGGQTVANRQRFGKAPYTRTNCASGGKVSQQLVEIIDQLRQGAKEQQWKVDWKRLDEMVAQAEKATASNDFSTSIRVYSRAISFLMDQLRNQHDDGGSSIDL